MQGQDLSQVKQYCLNTINSSLAAHIFAILNSIFELGKNTIPASRQSPWRTFQESLRDIVDWNQRRIDDITQTALEQCPSLEKLVATAMMCQASLLAGVRGIELEVKDLKKISTSRFIHDWLIQLAKELVHTPTLFGQTQPEQSSRDRQTVLSVINKTCETVIDAYVPISIILAKPTKPINIHHQSSQPRSKADLKQEFDLQKRLTRAQLKLKNLKHVKTMDSYLSDTFDTIQDPSILNLENDDGAEPVDSTTIEDTADPIVVEITQPPQPAHPTPTITAPPNPTQIPAVATTLPIDPQLSFIYAPSTVGSKNSSYADVKKLLAQTIS